MLVLAACQPKTVPPAAPAAAPAAPATPAASQEAPVKLNPVGVVGVHDPTLRKLLSDHWEWTMKSSPVWATMLGDRRFDDQLGDPSQAAVKANRAKTRAFLARAEAIDASALNSDDHLTLKLFRLGLQSAVDTEVCEFWQWDVSPRNNAWVHLSYVPQAHRITDAKNAEDLIARYQAMPAYLDTEVADLKAGIAQGRVANKDSVALVVQQLDEVLADPVDDWALFDLNVEDGAFEDELHRVVAKQVQPALVRYSDFLRDDVLPAARPEGREGLAALPGGDPCYAGLVHEYTTLQMTPDQLHQEGLDQLDAILARMQDLGDKLFGTRDLKAIFQKLRTDPDLYFQTAAQIQQTAQGAEDRARAALPAWFGRLPKAELVVRPVPSFEAPYTTIAYYRPPAPDGTKPGEYFVNEYQPTTRPRYEAEVLAYHEGIPGHHLQMSIAQELPGLPAFRKYADFTVFVEGWGLYAEHLADEMGLYSDDTSRMGMLSFAAWRASRLVVDTGIHSEGWSRQRAESFLHDNTPLADNNIANEVDRYITTPGQALAYETGALTIEQLRAQADKQLGDAFDIRAFHDTVLGSGALPMPILEDRVHAWVARVKAAQAKGAVDPSQPAPNGG